MDKKAKEILEIIEQAGGGQARIVGGFVRDSILGIKTDDIDIASTLLPNQCLELFSSLGHKAVPTGIEFGTVTIVFKGQPFEITTLRKDLNCDGRHAEVTYSKDFKEDAERRDFTFNALYMDKNGNITDYFDGQKDLAAHIVRFIGDASERIKEDYLRILRMFRFQAKYGEGDIIPEQLTICANLKAGLKDISGERIHQEMFKLLSYKGQYISLKQMVESGILSTISGYSNDYFDLSNLQKFLNIQNDNVNPVSVLASILNLDSADLNLICDRWRLSKKERKFLTRLLASKEIDYSDIYIVRKNLRVQGKEEFLEYVKIAFSLGKVKEGDFLRLKAQIEKYEPRIMPVSANDLISLGVKPGKKMGQLLRRAEEFWERNNYQVGKEVLIKELGL